MKVRTVQEAYAFVMEVKICAIFSEGLDGIPSLYDAIDLPHRSGGRTKWGARVEAIWAWKSELPHLHPDEIFYGKTRGGHAVLMTMDYLRETLYPQCHKPVSDCRELAQQIFELIRLDPGEKTAFYRVEAMERFGCSKSRFDTALKELQITFNIARSNETGGTQDLWLPFEELYPDVM